MTTCLLNCLLIPLFYTPIVFFSWTFGPAICKFICCDPDCIQCFCCCCRKKVPADEALSKPFAADDTNPGAIQ